MREGALVPVSTNLNTFRFSSDVDNDRSSESITASQSLPIIANSIIPPSSIESLPNEILALVFEAGLVTPNIFTEPPSPFQRLFSDKQQICPFQEVLVRVSYRWRQVAIHTPALWSILHISQWQEYFGGGLRLWDACKPLGWIDVYLQRSQQFPLDITFDSTGILPTVVMDRILPHVSRWRTLRILVSHNEVVPSVLAHLEDTYAPRLECLEICADIYHEGILPSQPMPAFLEGGTPNLTCVRLNRISLGWAFEQLTILELRFVLWPNYFQLREILAGSPSLERLVIHDDSWSILESLNHHPSLPAIHIPSLRELDIHGYRKKPKPEYTVARLIQLFSTPALESLALRYLNAVEWCHVLVYFKAFGKNYPVLRSLKLSAIKDLISVDSTVVRAFPLITHLSLSRIYSRSFLELIIWDVTDDHFHVPVWQDLHTLTICGDEHGSITLLRRAISARLTMGHPITELFLDKYFSSSSETLMSLKTDTKVTWISKID